MKAKCVTRFDRPQLVYLADIILSSALDRIESGLPTAGLDWADRLCICQGSDPCSFSEYERGTLEMAGMALACLYASLTGDGLGIGDALVCADHFDTACGVLLRRAWENGGNPVRKLDKELAANGPQSLSERYKGYWPNTTHHAEAFVDRVFDNYLKG